MKKKIHRKKKEKLEIIHSRKIKREEEKKRKNKKMRKKKRIQKMKVRKVTISAKRKK